MPILVADAQIALERGAEGVGLLRKEFLYLGRNSAFSEDEPLEIYRVIAQILDNRPFIVRTLDIGGDKPIPLHPAVLHMIHQTVPAAHQAGIWVGLCGEIAAEPLAIPLLLGLGIDEFSLNPQAIPTLKQKISQLTVTESEAIAASALKLDSAAKVISLLSA